MTCEHRRLKKNYPFGRKSKADKVCKDCGDIVTNKDIKERRKKRRNVQNNKVSGRNIKETKISDRRN